MYRSATQVAVLGRRYSAYYLDTFDMVGRDISHIDTRIYSTSSVYGAVYVVVARDAVQLRPRSIVCDRYAVGYQAHTERCVFVGADLTRRSEVKLMHRIASYYITGQ